MADILARDEIPGHDDGIDLRTSHRIYGPPGTGKTTACLSRTAHVLDDGVPLGRVGYITYRRSMAEAFLQDLAAHDLIPDEFARHPSRHSETRHIGTINGVGRRVAGLDTPDDPEAHKAAYCEEVWGMPFSNEDNSDGHGETMFGARSWCLSNLLDMSEWHRSPQAETIREERLPDLEEFHAQWENYKQREGIVDFADMLLDPLKNETPIPVSVLIVDEYHDVSPLMAKLVEMWASQVDTVVIAADRLQSIYGFAGGSPDHYDRVDLPEVFLDQSYRMPSKVWNYAQAPLAGVHDVPEVTPRIEGGTVVDATSRTLSASAAMGGTTPVDVLDRYGDETMFLARTRSQVRDVAGRLRDAGVIFDSPSARAAWNHAPKRRTLYNTFARFYGMATPESHGSTSAERLAQASLVSDEWADGTTPESVEFTVGDVKTLIESISADYIEGTKKSTLNGLRGRSYSATMNGRDVAALLSPDAFPVVTKGSVGAAKMLLGSTSGRNAIISALSRYEDEGTVEPVEGSFDTTVATIHAAKGTERRTVALYDGMPPSVSRALTTDEGEAEEARVWYVGASRARENLVVLRDGWGWCRPSPFLPPVEDVLGDDSDDGPQPGEAVADGGERR